MLRLTLEEWPGGDPNRRRVIGTIDISNVTDLAPISDYRVEQDRPGVRVARFVTGHVRSDGPWPLVAKALAALGWKP